MNVNAIVWGILNWLIMIIAAVLIVGLGFAVWWWRRKKRKYSEYKVIIFSFDGAGNLLFRYDRGGVFVDKHTRAKRLWLERGKSNLSADQIPFIIDQFGKKVVFLLHLGGKNYRYISFNIQPEGITYEVSEEDVNWAIHDYRQDVTQIQPQNKFLQYLPYISLAFVSMTILILFVWFFKKFDVLKAVATSLTNVAQSLKETAKQLALSKTTILK